MSSSLFQVLAVAGAFAVPALVHWWQRPSLVLLAVTVLWATLPLGLLAAPGLWPLWCCLAGIALNVRLVDSAQFYERQKAFDFDMMQFTYPASLSPGPTTSRSRRSGIERSRRATM